MIIHKTWCGACKALKKKVAEDQALAKYSSKLIVVNLEDDEVNEFVVLDLCMIALGLS